MSTALTLAITTYERPDALAAVLATVARQTDPPDEIIVADDGSGPDTQSVIARFGATARQPVHQVRQAHDGFRLARLRNLAIARATSDFIVFIDGDMLLHPGFIADHRRHARRRMFTQGVRVMLSPQLTARLLATPGALPGLAARGLGFRRRFQALHIPALSAWFRSLANHFISVKGANQGFWREDLSAVNGFNEEMIGWGPEDKELIARLARLGIGRQTLFGGGVAYHLHHAPASRERRELNEEIFARTLARGIVRCERGLDAHRASPP